MLNRGTYIVEINVDATKVVEHKISYGIGALNGIGICVERLQEPGILSSNEFACFLISPELRGQSVMALSVKGRGRRRRTLYS
jgi:hypothetical protein